MTFDHRGLLYLASRQKSFFGDFSKKVYQNNRRSMEELKYNNKQTVANSDPGSLRETPNGWMFASEKVVDIHRICYEVVL